MNSPDHRHLRTAWIPWILALVALFGVNALVPDDSRSGKSETPDEIGISQLADDARTPGRPFNPLVFLTPQSTSGIRILNPSSLVLCSAASGEIRVTPLPEGAIHGRAPPARSDSRVRCLA